MTMNQDRLKRKLQSIGKTCFIKYYEMFKDENCLNESLVMLISNNENYSIVATATRVNCARWIVRHNLTKEALEIITNSKKLDKTIKVKALELLQL